MRDFTFGPSRQRGHELCQAITAAGLRLRWSAECRIDVLDEALLDAMRRAGCEVILVGISPEIAQTITQLGIDVGSMATLSNLQAGITFALQRRGMAIAPLNGRAFFSRRGGRFVPGQFGVEPDAGERPVPFGGG